MIHNAARIGNFTSSEIAALMTEGRTAGTLGKPALTYVNECNMERNLGRSIDTELNARAVTWGQLVEKRVFELLGLEYQLVSKDTVIHPKYSFWSGSPDANKFDEGKTVVDIKSPLTLKSFCQLVEPIYSGLEGIEAINHVYDNHKDGAKYYWQLISNAILVGAKYAELIVYCPYLSELESIRDLARMSDGEKQYRYFWLNSAPDDELPFLIEGGYYRNINVIRFEVPEADKVALTERVLKCSELLKNIKQVA